MDGTNEGSARVSVTDTDIDNGIHVNSLAGASELPKSRLYRTMCVS